MKRYNIFNHDHKIIRACLYDTALCLQKTEYSNIQDADTAIKKIRQLLYFAKQLFTKEQQILAALDNKELNLVPDLNNYEKEYFKIVQGLNVVLQHYDEVSNPGEKSDTGCSINKSFMVFLISFINLMDKKETTINERIWNNYTDEYLVILIKKISSDIPEEQLISESQWAIKGINNQELVNWLMVLKDNASYQLFNSILEMIEKQLSEGRWNQIQGKITEGVSVSC